MHTGSEMGQVMLSFQLQVLGLSNRRLTNNREKKRAILKRCAGRKRQEFVFVRPRRRVDRELWQVTSVLPESSGCGASHYDYICGQEGCWNMSAVWAFDMFRKHLQ